MTDLFVPHDGGLADRMCNPDIYHRGGFYRDHTFVWDGRPSPADVRRFIREAIEREVRVSRVIDSLGVGSWEPPRIFEEHEYGKLVWAEVDAREGVVADGQADVAGLPLFMGGED